MLNNSLTRIGVYPGTFDPIHQGHLKTLQAAAQKYSLQRIILVPAGNTPSKGLISDSAPYERWKMLSLALSDIPGNSICPLEINTSVCSYTADSIDQIRSQNRDAALFLIIGEDNLASFLRWYRVEDIKRNSTVIVIRRRSTSEIRSAECAHYEYIEPVSDFSSSLLKTYFAEGRPVSPLVDASYEDFLYAFGMYCAPGLRAEIAYVRQHQKPTRFRHTIGVVKTAVKLSARFDVDPASVMEAAFLHDIAKELPADLMNAYAARASCDIGHTDIAAVLHAPAGAELAKALFSVSEELYHAILLHCTLDTEMTLLDKIIYISDMVEPSRHYPSVNKLRQALDEVINEHDLNAVLVLAIELNICYISSIGGVIHPASYRALETLKNMIN